MPAVATPAEDEAGIDTEQDWPIQTEWVRARVRTNPLNGTLKAYRPERRVCPDHHPETSWASMWRTEQRWTGLTEQETLDLQERLDARAQRLYQLDRLKEAIARKKQEAQERRREEAAAELKRYIESECAGLLEVYRDARPRRYEGGEDGGWTLVPLAEWAKTQLTPEESELVAERKEELRESYDLPGYVQLL